MEQARTTVVNPVVIVWAVSMFNMITLQLSSLAVNKKAAAVARGHV